MADQHYIDPSVPFMIIAASEWEEFYTPAATI